MPRTHRRHSSTHTWAPRHVRCALCGHNGMEPGVTYLFPVLAQRCLSLVQQASWRSHGHNAMVRWGTKYVADSSSWGLCMTQERNVLCTKKKQPWAQCHGSLLWSLTWQWELAICPGHGHLDMAWAHISVWERHIDAPDTWLVGWCMLLVQMVAS